MTPTTVEEVRELGRRWAEAEQRGDVEVLEALSVDDLKDWLLAALHLSPIGGPPPFRPTDEPGRPT
jgi:hypothetical protein